MPERWQVFPDAVLEEEQRRTEAGSWIQQQRAELADAWAKEQRRLLDEQRQQLAAQQRVDQQRQQFLDRQQRRLEPGFGQQPAATEQQPQQLQSLTSSLREEQLARQQPRPQPQPPAEYLRSQGPGTGGMADIPGGMERVLETSNRLGRGLLEGLARGGERMGAAARGEDWQSMPSVLEGGVQNLPEAWNQRPEMFPAQKGAMEALADPLNLLPGALFAKAGIGAMAGKPLAEAAGELRRFAPGMSLEETGGGAVETVKAFFSLLQKTVDDAKMPRATGSQWAGYLKAQGVKSDELFWTNAEDFLNSNAAKGVSKQELADFVRRNQVQVEEVVKGPDRNISFNSPDMATKFARLTLPGSENYRELLLILPNENSMTQTSMRAGRVYRNFPDVYNAPHWDEPNVLAHIRFSDRIGADGKKVLFIEEIQSDWHQAGREGGYARKITSLPEGYRVSPSSSGQTYTVISPDGEIIGFGTTPELAIERGLAILRDKEFGKVPPAPFSKTWPDLALKRMFKWASDAKNPDGSPMYDRIAWTPGKVHAAVPKVGERPSYYGTERLAWVKRGDGYSVTVEPQVGGRVGDIDVEAEATARGLASKHRPIFVENKEQLQYLLDNAITEKPGAREIAENRTMADKLWSRMQAADEGIYTPRAEGMAGFYDEKLPEIANKIGKRFGARVEVSDILTRRPLSGVVHISALEDTMPTKVHSLNLTPAMRQEALTKGFPIFTRPGTVGDVAGGLAGATQGDTPEERARNALLGAAGGALGAEGLALAPKAIKAAAPMAGKLLREESGVLNLGPAGMPIPSPKPPSKPHPVKGKPLYGPSQDTGWEHTWNRTRNVLSHMGTSGRELAERLHEWRSSRMEMAGDWVTRMPTVRKLSKQEFENFADVAETKAQPLSAKVQQAFQEWSVIRDEVYARAKAAGLDVGFLKDYFPHRFDSNMLFAKGNKWQEMIDHLKSIGAAKTDAGAEAILFRLRNQVRIHKVSNLELQRKFNLPGYKRDLHAVLAYTEEAAEGIARAEQLGYKNAIANKLLAKMARQGWDKYRAEDLFAIATGGKDRDPFWENASGVVRAANVLTKLSLGALTNAAQSVNTATVGGGLRTLLRSPRAAFSPEAHEFALRAGIILDSTIAQVMQGGGFTRRASAIGAPLFQNVERFNRTLASNVGREMAKDAFKAGDAKALSELGLDAQAILQRGNLTIEDEVRAAQNIVERTQFYVEPQDLMGWASSPLGKLVMQFRTFGYNQTAFMGREVLLPAAKGNVKPLIRFLLYGLPTAAMVVGAQDFLRQRQSQEQSLPEYLMRLGERIGTLGVLGDVLRGVDPRQAGNLPGYTSRVASTVFGPSMGTFLEGVSTLPGIAKGNFEPLGRFALKQVPIIGPTAKNVLMPRDESSGTIPQIGGSRLTYPGTRRSGNITPAYPGGR